MKQETLSRAIQSTYIREPGLTFSLRHLFSPSLTSHSYKLTLTLGDLRWPNYVVCPNVISCWHTSHQVLPSKYSNRYWSVIRTSCSNKTLNEVGIIKVCWDQLKSSHGNIQFYRHGMFTYFNYGEKKKILNENIVEC